MAAEPGIEPLPEGLVEALGGARAYAGDPAAAAGGVESIQTHISHVFLTRERVYKLRKAVRLPFLSFATREERNADCLREVALNRRLAPDVYLGVAPLLAESGGFRVGGVGESLRGGETEHCVVMRRLPEGRDGLSLLQAGELGPEHVDAVASRLAAFHAEHGLGAPAPFGAAAWRERASRPFLDCIASARDVGFDEALLARAEARAEARLEAIAPRLEERRRDGRAVDGHGDVHLQHVWFERDGAPPLLVDCIEFDDDLRRIDTASEVAFLAMDLAYRGRRDLGERFVRTYAARTDDFSLYDVVDYYASYRAAVRGKVAALAAGDASIGAAQREAAAGSARRHWELASALLEPRAPGAIACLCGVVGTGKSSAARILADALAAGPGAAVIASDRTRKHLAGLDATASASAAPGRGLYTEESREAVYAALLERARPVVDSGRVAVLDATYGSEGRRREARAWASSRGLRAWLVETRCAGEEARARLARRRAEGRDPSDAGPELHAASERAFEPPLEWPASERFAIETDAAGWEGRLREVSRRITAEASAADRGAP